MPQGRSTVNGHNVSSTHEKNHRAVGGTRARMREAAGGAQEHAYTDCQR